MLRNVFVLLLWLCANSPAHTVDFQRVIRPILSESCFHCHGPDKATRMVDLRLDTQDGAFSERKSGRVLVPGNPEASLLYQRVVHANTALKMPPVASGKRITPAQQQLIKRWIEQGAEWKEHWSFVAPRRPAMPAVTAKAWVKNPIDAFVLARLEQAKLTPAAEADRRTLARRVSLDLTGLPPDPAEVERFVKDSAPNAYESFVDRTLESPHYGEHRARFWLDAARYGDTHGIHIDNYREMWPYRDWVIKAFNQNMRFDAFTIEQIAGDLLPKPSLEQLIATGFNRCNATTNEGGSIVEEVEAMYAKDRVDTTSTVWLGLTAGCASCHDHKFDPLSQRDFYSFAAFFRNTTQRAMDGNIADTPPVIVVPAVADRPRWGEWKAQLADLRKQAGAATEQALAEVKSHWAVLQRLDPEFPLGDGVEAYRLAAEPDAAALPKGVTVIDAPPPGLKALRFEAKSKVQLPPAPGLSADKPFSLTLWVYLPKAEEGFPVLSQIQRLKPKKDEEDEDTPTTNGWVLAISSRIPMLRFSAKNTLNLRGSNAQRLKPGEWAHLGFTYDGSRYQAGVQLYMNGKPAATEGGDRSRRLEGELLPDAPLRLGGDLTRSFTEGAIADVRIYNRELTADEVAVIRAWPSMKAALAKGSESASAEDLAALNTWYLTRIDDGYRKLTGDLLTAKTQLRTIEYRSPVTHVMYEKPGEPKANILYRGMYDQPRDEVPAAVPGVLPGMSPTMPRNRLGLAQWLVAESNPLTARVTVNRFWQEVFGTGLVKTSEDFGSQGQPPTHPELLDWLAVEFRDSGWDVKRLMKLMLLSSTYRQAAVATEAKLKADPENRLLSRGPRFRMDGEMVRDLALFASGLMHREIGGPSVKPYQPENVWETVAMKGSNTRFYKQDHGEKLYRRSMYTFWKRAAPPASMEVFNAPTRETCTVRRERTNTPLQALVTLNDPQFVEASRVLAERAIKTGPGFDDRLNALTTVVLARPFNVREKQVAQRALRDFLAYFDASPDRSTKLLGVGESKADASLSAVELAAWTMLASDVLNLDEALNK